MSHFLQIPPANRKRQANCKRGSFYLANTLDDAVLHSSKIRPLHPFIPEWSHLLNYFDFSLCMWFPLLQEFLFTFAVLVSSLQGIHDTPFVDCSCAPFDTPALFWGAGYQESNSEPCTYPQFFEHNYTVHK